MDCFIKIKDEKKDEQLTTIHVDELKQIKDHIKNNKNVFIYGCVGSGKTHLLKILFNDKNSINIEPEDIKSGMFDLLRGTEKHIIIEDYSKDIINLKKVIESVSDGEKITNGSIVVTTSQFSLYPNFENVNIIPKIPEMFVELVKDKKDIDHITSIAKKANGNIRDFFDYLGGSDIKDIFKNSKDFIVDVLCTHEKVEMFDHTSEHGHIWDVFQENYVNSKKVNIAACSDSFSITDIFDTEMYRGTWDLMPYFILNSVVIPKYHMGELINISKIRPGKCWTKYGNYKMRRHKLEEIITDSKTNIDINALGLLKKYAENDNIDILREYNITPQKFDIMNHLAITSRLKQKDVTRIKKMIKAKIDDENVHKRESAPNTKNVF